MHYTIPLLQSCQLDLGSGRAIKLILWFFSNLVGEEGPRIPGVKDSSVCFFEILSALLTFFRFLLCLFLLFPIHIFQ